MGIFESIRDAIFGHPQAPLHPSTPQSSPMSKPAAQGQVPQPKASPSQPPNVDAILAAAAEKKGHPSNYKSSIVDLMKLLDLDASLAHRKELAKELGYTGALDGSAEMNIWLHREVMKRLAANGGNISAELRG